MSLDQKAIEKLKQIHFEEFGERLTNQEAWDMGIRLVNIFKSLACGPELSPDNEKDRLTEQSRTRYDYLSP